MSCLLPRLLLSHALMQTCCCSLQMVSLGQPAIRNTLALLSLWAAPTSHAGALPQRCSCWFMVALQADPLSCVYSQALVSVKCRAKIDYNDHETEGACTRRDTMGRLLQRSGNAVSIPYMFTPGNHEASAYIVPLC
jgi:hypothetical protein